MKTITVIIRSVLVAGLFVVAACEDLSELNVNENGANQLTANPNLLLPTVMTSAATTYLDYGLWDIAGVMQHTQKTGWFGGHNYYDWGPRDWSNWYGMLRSNELIYERAVELEMPFHQGIALTMRAFIFGVIADLWGDAPYNDAVRGDEGVIQPAFDSQEVIYEGVIADLQKASTLFATGDNTGMLNQYDVYFNGDMEKWHRFSNTLLMRYYMRISAKKESVAKAGIESIYNGGVYISDAADDATMAFIGANTSNAFPTSLTDDGTRFRNPKAATTLIDRLVAYNDPRLEVWFDPVRVQWIEDATLPTKMDEFIRKNGVLTTATDIKDMDWREELEADPTVVYTRHFNPAHFAAGEQLPVTGAYVGIPPGLVQPDYHNYNPTPGQTVENQHVSSLDGMYMDLAGDLLRARLASAAETHFILAEAATKGWSVGSAQQHYETGIRESLKAWGVSADFAAYLAEPDVAFPAAGTEQQKLERIIEQKWIASWTSAVEAWMDYRRTGLPALQAGPASSEPVLPVRFIYSDEEVLRNEANAMVAIGRLEKTEYSNLRGANSQWSKPWVIQGTSKPW